MTELLDSISNQYKERFNFGYIYSQAFPEISQKIVGQNKSMLSEDTPISALIAGMNEFILEKQRKIITDFKE
ncbi:MAG TPA: hypothetical protein VGF79_04590, partial [Bacteroidia bacterium]